MFNHTVPYHKIDHPPQAADPVAEMRKLYDERKPNYMLVGTAVYVLYVVCVSCMDLGVGVSPSYMQVGTAVFC